jgi:Tol biopolymer transport system component/DNA-binding winged helix-turn-helix (wHTH) protein
MIFRFDSFVFDSDERVLWRGAELVAVPPKTLEMLGIFVASEGRVLSKLELMEKLWPDSFVEESNLTQNIFVLRKALGRTEDGQPLIETLSKRGYRFAVPVQRAEKVPLAARAEVQTRDVPADKPHMVTSREFVRDAGSLPEQRAVLRQGTTGRWSRYRTAAVVAMVVICAAAFLWSRLRAPVRVGAILRLTNDGRVKNLYPAYWQAPLVQSGNELIFTEFAGGQNQIGRTAITGGGTTAMTLTSPGDYVVGAGQGSNTVLLSSAWSGGPDGGMLEQNLETGTTQALDGVFGHDGSWSPDGKRLVYARGGELLVRTTESGGVRLVPLAQLGGRVYWVRWSPDGRRIRFTESFDGYQDEMWEVNADGANLHLLFQQQTNRKHVCCGSWTADGRAFVYLSQETNGNSIVIAPEPGGWWQSLRSTSISAAPLDAWGGPTPGSDGKHVYALGQQMHGSLVRINPLTRRTEPYLDGISAEGVAFSPDGQWIAYTAYPEGTLWRSRVNGGDRMQLTRAPQLARFPRWSPDGKTILFVAGQAGSDWELYTVAASGGQVRRLLWDDLGQGVGNWSVHGDSIYFGRLLSYTHDGSKSLQIEQLHLRDGTTTMVPGSANMWTARLSPDGRYLSAVSSDNRILRLCDLASGTWTDVARVGVNDVAWSPDGRSLFFDVDRGDEGLIYRFRVADRKLEQWADLHAFRRAGFFSPWLGMAPDGSPLLLQDASIQEIYAIGVKLP